MGYLMNGVISGGLPLHISGRLRSAHEIKYFVETGTAGGDSIGKASIYFKECHTIEIKTDVPLLDRENINYHIGNSVEILPEIIKTFDDSYALFFLDAHYSDSEPSDGKIKECPVIEEIQAIGAYPNSLIIIDDARLFMGVPPYPLDPRQWPGIVQIFEELRKYFAWHYITVTDDYIICIPIHFRVAIDEEWRERFPIRYPNAEDKLKTELKSAYKELKRRFKEFKNYIDV